MRISSRTVHFFWWVVVFMIVFSSPPDSGDRPVDLVDRVDEVLLGLGLRVAFGPCGSHSGAPTGASGVYRRGWSR
jgi:hypothetical protein